MNIRMISTRFINPRLQKASQPLKHRISTSINHPTTSVPFTPSSSNLNIMHSVTPAQPSYGSYSTEMLTNPALNRFNETLRKEYFGQINRSYNRSDVLKLAKKATHDLSKGGVSWPFPDKIKNEFKQAFDHNPHLFDPSESMPIDSDTIAPLLKNISSTEFKPSLHAIPTPSSKITAALAFHTLKKLGVTHVAAQVPWFTPSIIAALSANLTIVPIFSTDEIDVCNDLQYFSNTYGDRGVLLHNATNPIYRELSDEASKKVTNQFERTGTFLISDCAYFGFKPLLPNTGLLKTYLATVGSNSHAIGWLSGSKSTVRIANSRTGIALSNNPKLLEALSKEIKQSNQIPSKLDTQFALNSLEYAASDEGKTIIHEKLSNCAMARDKLIKELSSHNILIGNTDGIFLSIQIHNKSGYKTLFRIPTFELTNENYKTISNTLINANNQGLNPSITPYKELFNATKGLLALDHSFFLPPTIT